jgi:hypothetical protein
VKVKKGALDFGTDAAAAEAALLRDAIADGAVTGLSAAVQSAFSRTPTSTSPFTEGLKVQAVEDELSDLGGTMNKAFRDFEKQAKERVRIATQYGFDVVKIEEINADERTELSTEYPWQPVGSLRTLLADLSFGDLFEGSITDQMKKLQERPQGEARTRSPGSMAPPTSWPTSSARSSARRWKPSARPGPAI